MVRIALMSFSLRSLHNTHTQNLQCRVALVSIKKAVLEFVKRGMWVGIGCARELRDVGILV
jgi:hypothetical protein